jgi:hypothetical protein
VGEGVATGHLSAGDVDVFRLDGRKGQPFTITVAPPKRADLILEVLPPGDARWMRADTAKRGGNESLALTPAADGPIYVRISGKRDLDSEEESYRMMVDPNVAPHGGPGASPGPASGAPR